jgi:transposase
MPKHKSEDFKMSAVEYYLTEDVSQEQVCKIFKCSPRSLMRWVEKYDEEGEIKRHNRQPIAYKIKQNKMKLSLYLMKLKKIKQLLWKIY